ncbi:tRNA (N6-threonylcarbamoyladenosine(37)-N6)-methyltransferase TrmO [Candidatus Daviesbacteria bacterium RIFCSPLOWO2_02_FULL_41_8]|uniref:tRNA (N6-threonylcarbamoyladenosine(37)-N6)-methyltransferase TrmO n=2 Tax=Candidatus Daviesiibacteriota TaxID=1752718 RepID=A0A1F5NHT7_9BACT|nr:MAG: tRNA (N6-threonylcarbamoyladenosine(37)-N6)-methyltransferase TrmO [Candidatus Daviesbacteria bacterium RIFCSPHIGHO2_01_FULL_41_23]OGE62234.1 MAG: tRNA (N6-threonylcarbamoyladenosine(37)-N6)-methyltransferase TrmO [Candidatus Daviesbacteria bacterium RIFCSPLOWO2_01_FULL_41_32]OGE77072.1 MAG: tRNA (N6-threonylcarbamoyladenosine(37)-N6)-methyltransferase TrmO [Candidatus Daviesbacteria bacterium RIFCSPLOWO2_02_FULL_41_8]
MKTIFCNFLDSQDKDGTIKVKPLGNAKNSVNKPTLPGWKDVTTEIAIDKNYAKGLDGIEDYSHIIVVYWMDREKECHLKHHPQGRENIPFIGIFACRCPQRPNRIAISTVELLSREGNTIKVKGLDIVDGTPILDIKPYTPEYDLVEKARVPEWVNKLVF